MLKAAVNSQVPDAPTHPFYPGIQGLRGWAALIVVMYHVHVLFQKEKYFGSVLFGGFFEFGHRGVELFFVISGFLMAMLMNNPLVAPRAGEGPAHLHPLPAGFAAAEWCMRHRARGVPCGLHV